MISKKIKELEREIKDEKNKLWETEIKRRSREFSVKSYMWNGDKKNIIIIPETELNFKKRMETVIYPIRLNVAKLQLLKELFLEIEKKIDECDCDKDYRISVKQLKQKLLGGEDEKTNGIGYPA
jgi:hypothetical protein